MNVTALIPAHDEAGRVGATVRALSSTDIANRIIVIDDGSTDATSSEASLAGSEIVTLETNCGKGTALDAGLGAAGDGWDVLLMLDADLGDSASEARVLLGPIFEGTADMTIARFPQPAGKAGFGLVKNAARKGIQRLGDPSFVASAPLSGQRAMTREMIDAVTPFAFGYGVEVALTIRSLRAGFTVVEVPTTMTHAATGRDIAGFVHRGKQYLHVKRALHALARESRR